MKEDMFVTLKMTVEDAQIFRLALLESHSHVPEARSEIIMKAAKIAIALNELGEEPW